jgi:3-hydroxyethyl bacteriochlorophyllide a dehydrogenase
MCSCPAPIASRARAGCSAGAAARVVTDARRVTPIDAGLGPEGALLALAATARHAMAGVHTEEPDLIVGHGVLGRLLARLALAAGVPAPTVWEIDPGRMGGAAGYEVVHPDNDPRRDYHAIYDASGDPKLLDHADRTSRQGRRSRAWPGFYAPNRCPSHSRPRSCVRRGSGSRRNGPAMIWSPRATLIDHGALSPRQSHLAHRSEPRPTPRTLTRRRSTDPACLKMILNWKRTPHERSMCLTSRTTTTSFAEEAAEPTLEVPQGEPTKKTQIIAIYGKGGIGKSFTLANLSRT